jgi:ribosomal protein S18 acetylase RimI-like enzyme
MSHRGLAVALVGAGEKKLAGMGAVRLTAIVADDERPAIALWESVGYERQADMSRFVRVLTG